MAIHGCVHDFTDTPSVHFGDWQLLDIGRDSIGKLLVERQESVKSLGVSVDAVNTHHLRCPADVVTPLPVSDFHHCIALHPVVVLHVLVHDFRVVRAFDLDDAVRTN